MKHERAVIPIDALGMLQENWKKGWKSWKLEDEQRSSKI